ncbi:unnamed protein product, partial [Meganyctiphanes norvegica]
PSTTTTALSQQEQDGRGAAAQIFRNCLNDFFQDEETIESALKELVNWHKKMEIKLGPLDSPLLLALLTELYAVAPETFRQMSSNSDIHSEVQDMVSTKLIEKLVREGMLEKNARENCTKYLELFQEKAFESFCHRRPLLSNDAVQILKNKCIELNLPPELVLLTYLCVSTDPRNPEANKVFLFWDTNFLAHNIAIYLAKRVIQHCTTLVKLERTAETSNCTVQSEADIKLKQKKGILKSIRSKFTKKSSKKPQKDHITNIIKKIFIEEYLTIHKKTEKIKEAENILLTDVFMFLLLFTIGAIKRQQDSALTQLAEDFISLAVEGVTYSGASDVNGLLLMVSESGQNDAFVKCAAERITKILEETGSIVINEGSFIPFRHVLKVTVPELIGITVNEDPAKVSDLVETLQDVATQDTDVALTFLHTAYHINSTTGDIYLQTLVDNSRCRVTQYGGSLNDIQILPLSLQVVHLHLKVEQLQELNGVLQIMGSLQFLGIALVCGDERPPVEFMPQLEVPDHIQDLSPGVAANLTDDDSDISYALDILKKLCPQHHQRLKCRDIGFFNTKFTAVGMEKVLEALHREGFQAHLWVGFKTTSTGTREQVNRLNFLAQRLNLTSVQVSTIGVELKPLPPYDTQQLNLHGGLYGNKPGIPSMGIVN